MLHRCQDPCPQISILFAYSLSEEAVIKHCSLKGLCPQISDWNVLYGRSLCWNQGFQYLRTYTVPSEWYKHILKGKGISWTDLINYENETLRCLSGCSSQYKTRHVSTSSPNLKSDLKDHFQLDLPFSDTPSKPPLLPQDVAQQPLLPLCNLKDPPGVLVDATEAKPLPRSASCSQGTATKPSRKGRRSC